MSNAVISHNDNFHEDTPLIAELASAGVNGMVYKEDDQQAIIINYEPKESFTYGNVKIKPASIEYSGYAHNNEKIAGTRKYMDNKNVQKEIELLNLNQLLPANINNNQITKFSTEIREFQEQVMPWILDSTNYSYSPELCTIKNGKITWSLLRTGKKDEINLDLIKVINQVNLINKLSENDAKAISDVLFLENPILFSKPINFDTPKNSDALSIKDVIAGSTYSGYKTEVLEIFSKFNINAAPLYKDAFIITALDIASKLSTALSIEHIPQNDGAILAVERNEPLRLIYETHSEINSKAEFDEAGGFYRPDFNLIKFENADALTHEITHAAMNIIFANKANPYPENKGEVSDAFEVAERSVLLNLASKLGHQLSHILDNYTLKDKIESLPEIKLFHKALHGDSLNWFEKYEIESKLSELKITNHEALVISNIGALLLDYKHDSFARELVAKTAELYYQAEIDPQIMEEILAPINSFWKEHVHPLVLYSVESHQNECTAGLIENSTFNYCIDELITDQYL